MNYSKRVIKLQEGIYGVRGIWLGGFSFFNTYSYIICSEINGGVFLVDTCGPGSGEIIKHALESIGKSGADITGIALTHWHKDHTGSLAELVSMAGAPAKPVKVFIHREDAPIYLAQKTRFIGIHHGLKLKVPHRPGKLPENGRYQLIPLDQNPAENPLDEWGFEFIHTPGHTPGHTSFLHRKSMSLFPGCGLSLFDKNTVGIVPVYYDREKQIESAQRLAATEFSYLYPAHLSVRADEIKRESRIQFKGKLPLIDRFMGTRPFFRYPEI